MNKILGINNENYIDTLLSKKYFHLKLTNCQPQITYLTVSQLKKLYTGYLNKDISFGDIIYFEPKNIQYKMPTNGVTDRFEISLIQVIVTKYQVILRYQLYCTLLNYF